ncbi:hypothetical protein COE01_14825 [Bacillus thuringiensis]|uniref:hypothetical protein n=1 Tax=Bacillus thuringiensis TaxID=1428 RepID=UPI000BF37B52|nr:hypothetical protein [Bacillus thuringiensis]PEW44425.1 hypothetical protein CN444_18250 [Bacillus thuringiensis]PFK07729.1 hypothetical protein COJ17_28180 [Bacillus thuringiensis]PGW83294.1 hypothetical protein COE01_14825 [Bacillus thuringiensis]
MVQEGLNWLESLGVFTLGAATVTGIFSSVFTMVATHKLRKREENHKTELREREEAHKTELRKREIDYKTFLGQQIEVHKSELKKLNDQYQITYGKLHVDRAETIKNLYQKLVELELSTRNLLGLGKTMDEGLSKDEIMRRRVKVKQKYLALEDYYMINQIYFSKEICKSFNELRSNTRITLAYFDAYHEEDGVGNKKTEKQTIEHYINNEFPKVKEVLEIHFRRLLGVSER